jgi:hypothetical protein
MVDSSVGEFAGYVITSNGNWRPRKTIIPSPNNLLLRLGYEDAEVKDPFSFIAYALGKVYGENSGGMPLSERARLFIQLFRCESDEHTYTNVRRSYYWRILQNMEKPVKELIVQARTSDEVLAKLVEEFEQTCPIATKLALSAKKELEAARHSYETILLCLEEKGVLLREVQVPAEVAILDSAWFLNRVEEEVCEWRNKHCEVGDVLDGYKGLNAFKRRVFMYQMQNAIRSIHRVMHDIHEAEVQLLCL